MSVASLNPSNTSSSSGSSSSGAGLVGGGGGGPLSQSGKARCVFVGNIPYDATEEQLTEIFQEAGPVVSFRLVFDRDSGKPKGYGFCEYRDAETALSAMRNLNNHDFNGRPLRVDFADNEKTQMQQIMQASIAAKQGGTRTLPQAPPNAASSPETVNSMLEGMNSSQLYDIVAKMKGMIQQNPEQAKQVLMSNPPLAYALLQAQALLGMINMQAVQKLLISKPSPPSVPAQPPFPMPIQPLSQPVSTPMSVGPSPAILPTPPNAYIPPLQQPPGAPFVQPIIKPQQPFVQQPPLFPSVPPPPPQLAEVVLPEQQKLLLAQVMSLTQEQVDKLPPEQRQHVQQLRQTFLAMRFS